MKQPDLLLCGALSATLAAIGAGGCNFTIDDSDDGDDGGSDTSSLGMITRIQTGEFYAGKHVDIEAVITGIEHSDTGSPNYTYTGIEALFVSDVLEEAEPYSGIYAQLPTSEALGQYAVGDLIQIDGLYNEYYGGSQIEIVTVLKLGDADAPTPVYIADPATVATVFKPGSDGWSPSDEYGAAANAHEGVLVEIRDVQVTVGNLGHGMFAVTGGLAIDPMLYYSPPPHLEGTRYSKITGILTYSFDAFKLAPRSYDDFVP